MEVISGLVVLLMIASLVFTLTPKVYDVCLMNDSIVIKLFGRYVIKRVPFSAVSCVSTKRLLVSYLPFPFFGGSASSRGSSFINRGFRPYVYVCYRKGARYGDTEKLLVVSPRDPEMFVAEVQRRLLG